MEILGPPCTWTYDDHEYAPKWDTECGQAHAFTEGGPVENDHLFCPYCGLPISIGVTTDGIVNGIVPEDEG